MATTENVPGSLDYILRVWCEKPDEPEVFPWSHHGEKFRSVHVHGACAIPKIGEQIASDGALYEVFDVVHRLSIDETAFKYNNDEIIRSDSRMPIVLAYLQKRI